MAPAQACMPVSLQANATVSDLLVPEYAQGPYLRSIQPCSLSIHTHTDCHHQYNVTLHTGVWCLSPGYSKHFEAVGRLQRQAQDVALRNASRALHLNSTAAAVASWSAASTEGGASNVPMH